MQHTIEYVSSRAEVWRTYWRCWARPAGLWRIHVAIALGVGLAWELLLHESDWRLDRLAAVAAAAGLACITLFPLWPQLRFKSAKRALTIDPMGFKTKIGNVSGERNWQEIAAVEDRGDEILIFVRNGNALVVPRRAFRDDAARAKFLNDAKAWHLAVAQEPV